MPRLPEPGSDNGTWGDILNEFLLVEHGNDGTLRKSAIIDAKVNRSGDTMAGPLNLPTDGLKVGGDQLIVNGGNIGIGTDSPAPIGDPLRKVMQVQGPVEGSEIRLNAGMKNGRLFNNGTQFGFGTDSPMDIFFFSGGGSNNRLQIKNDTGNIGIGTATPGGKLTISKSSATSTPLEDDSAILIKASGETQSMRMSVNNTAKTATIQSVEAGVAQTDLLLNPAGGNVGIGVGNAAFPLHVVGSSGTVLRADTPTAALGDTVKLDFNSSRSFVGYEGARQALALQANSAKTIVFDTDGIGSLFERMRITETGNIGIGTTTPGGKLHVAGGAILLTNGETNAEGMRIESNYDVSALNPGSSIIAGRITNRSLGHLVLDIQANEGGDSFAIRTDKNFDGVVDTIALTVKPSGNVGIGTTTPHSLLLVNGSIAYKRTAVADLAYTASATDYLVAYTSLTASRTVTLPTAVGIAGRTYVIKDESGSASGTVSIIIDPSGTETLDGAATKSIATAYGSLEVYSNGANWFTK